MEAMFYEIDVGRILLKTSLDSRELNKYGRTFTTKTYTLIFRYVGLWLFIDYSCDNELIGTHPVTNIISVFG